MYPGRNLCISENFDLLPVDQFGVTQSSVFSAWEIGFFGPAHFNRGTAWCLPNAHHIMVSSVTD